MGELIPAAFVLAYVVRYPISDRIWEMAVILAGAGR